MFTPRIVFFIQLSWTVPSKPVSIEFESFLEITAAIQLDLF